MPALTLYSCCRGCNSATAEALRIGAMPSITVTSDRTQHGERDREAQTEVAPEVAAPVPRGLPDLGMHGRSLHHTPFFVLPCSPGVVYAERQSHAWSVP